MRLFTSSIGLLILLMYFPGGLMQIVYQLRDAVLDVGRPPARRRDGVAAPVPAIAKRVPTATSSARSTLAGDGAVARRCATSSVRFGGNHAVDHVSLDVRAGELVGLIGTNGAGKSTLMNAIGGFVPADGVVEVLGHDVSGLPAYRRHRVGLGRGFQAARLYPGAHRARDDHGRARSPGALVAACRR